MSYALNLLAQAAEQVDGEAPEVATRIRGLADELVQLRATRAAEVAALARGNASSHTWLWDGCGSPRCATCQTKATTPVLARGAVPPCSPDLHCPLGWHAITLGRLGEQCGTCYHCHKSWPVAAEPVTDEGDSATSSAHAPRGTS